MATKKFDLSTIDALERAKEAAKKRDASLARYLLILNELEKHKKDVNKHQADLDKYLNGMATVARPHAKIKFHKKLPWT